MWWTVGALVPNHYRLVLRVRAPDPSIQDWCSAYRDLFDVIASIGERHTSSPDRAWFAVWEGHRFDNATETANRRRHAARERPHTAQMERADALLFGRVTYEMMESAWRRPATGAWPDWMDDTQIPFARTIDQAKKYVVSSTLSGVDWNAELMRGDLGQSVQHLKQEPGGFLWVEA